MSILGQKQIRENVIEAQDYVHDLDRWRASMKAKDERLLSLKESDSTNEKSGWDGVDTTDVGMSDLEIATELRNRGNEHFRDRNYERAIALYTESIEKDRTCFSFANRAQAYLKKESFSEAEADCNEAIKLDSAFSKAYYRRSLARKGLGQMRNALADAEMTVKLQPDSEHNVKIFKELLRETMAQEEMNPSIHWRRKIESIQHIPEQEREQKHSLNEADGEATVQEKEEEFKIPPVPKTWAEFESAFKLLMKHPSLFSTYLFLIPTSSLSRVFSCSLTAPILLSILETVVERMHRNVKEIEHWILFLERLNKIPRYGMITMCLTASQKESLQACWNQHQPPDPVYISKIEPLLPL